MGNYQSGDSGRRLPRLCTSSKTCSFPGRHSRVLLGYREENHVSQTPRLANFCRSCMKDYPLLHPSCTNCLLGRSSVRPGWGYKNHRHRRDRSYTKCRHRRYRHRKCRGLEGRGSRKWNLRRNSWQFSPCRHLTTFTSSGISAWLRN